MKILVLGASGMIGNTMLRVLSEKKDWEIYGSVRDRGASRFFPDSIAKRMIAGVDLERQETLIRLMDKVRPGVVINCVGMTKHQPDADDPLAAIPINTLMPHRLAGLCSLAGARLIHVSTDCVFSGEKGGYVEGDFPDARDVYGKSKALGEVIYPHTITLRTSTIGHELQSSYGLLDWFLSQESRCSGFRRAIFSGLPTVVFAQIVRDIVILRPELSGLYHIAAEPINKFTLLKMVADVYEKKIEITPDDRLTIDRSLNAERFRTATGFIAPDWPSLLRTMHAHK